VLQWFCQCSFCHSVLVYHRRCRFAVNCWPRLPSAIVIVFNNLYQSFYLFVSFVRSVHGCGYTTCNAVWPLMRGRAPKPSLAWSVWCYSENGSTVLFVCLFQSYLNTQMWAVWAVVMRAPTARAVRMRRRRPRRRALRSRSSARRV